MNSTRTACLIVFIIVESGLCGSYFQLVTDSGQLTGQEGSSQARPMDKAFFECDREALCTYVIQDTESQNYTAVYGEISTDQVSIAWKKIVTNILPVVEETVSQKLENIALAKPALLSSIYSSGSNASLAVDGKKSNEYFSNCAQSDIENKPWLIVDLLATAIVRSVSILSVEEEYRTMEAVDIRAGNSSDNGGIGNPACQLKSAIPKGSNILDVKCPVEMIARYVTVNTSQIDLIQICEIEIYGFYV